MNNLRVELIEKFLPRHEDGDDPQEAGEQEVEGAEQEVKPPDRWHPPIVPGAGHQFIRHDHRHLLGPIPDTQYTLDDGSCNH